MASPTGMDIFKAPACLISTDTSNKLQVNKHVMEQVEQLNGPLVVIGIAGLYRTGKSYLLNRLALSPGPGAPKLLNKTSGFALGSTIESKTKGIWIWARVHPLHPDQYIILLDTEGLGDVHKGDPNHDNWIFCLTTLLSSVLCYNAKGAIDEDALRKLNFITEMSKHIRTSSENVTDQDFDTFFPHFVYVIRDFHLDLEKNGREITEDEYLEDSLSLKVEEKGKESKHVQEFNFPRLCIRKYFKRRRCFVFDFPVMSSKLMKKLDEISDSQISEDFLEQTVKFCDYLFNKAPIKKLENGQEIVGRMWASLVTTYVESIRSGKVPNVENAVTSMAIIENSQALEHCMKLYCNMMETGISMPTPDEKVLSNHHFECLKKTVGEFLKRAVFDKDNGFQKELNEQIKQQYARYVNMNEQKSIDLCRQVLSELLKPYQKCVADGKYARSGGFRTYQADMDAVKSAFNATNGLGVKKSEVLLEFLQKVMEEGRSVLATDNKVSDEERKAEHEKAKALEAEKQRMVAEEGRERAEREAAEREKAYAENVRQLQDKMAAELQAEREHHQKVLDERMKEQARLLQEGFNEQSNALKKQIADLQHRINNPPRPPKKRCVIM